MVLISRLRSREMDHFKQSQPDLVNQGGTNIQSHGQQAGLRGGKDPGEHPKYFGRKDNEVYANNNRRRMGSIGFQLVLTSALE